MENFCENGKDNLIALATIALSVKEIASIAGVSHQNVMRMAQNLEKRGFVRILKDSTDRRVKRIVLTSQCQKYFINRDEREISFLNRLFWLFAIWCEFFPLSSFMGVGH
nr:MarR family transcriptional regulator [Evansella caseinilytica]